MTRLLVSLPYCRVVLYVTTAREGLLVLAEDIFQGLCTFSHGNHEFRPYLS